MTPSLRSFLLSVVFLPAAATAHVSRVPVPAELGACIARQNGDVARALLASAPGSETEHKYAAELFGGADDACRGAFAGLGARVGDVRGIAAEAMLESDPAARSRLAARAPLPVVRASAQLDGRAFVLAYAACLADAQPARSVTLLAAPHRSQAELDAFRAYGETLNDCMPEGVSSSVDRSDVRSHIAAHLYQTAMAAEGGR